MEKDVIERKLKAELDFFKVYAVFIIGLITGDVNIYLKYVTDENERLLYLLILGVILALFIIILFIRTIFSIRKLTKSK